MVEVLSRIAIESGIAIPPIRSKGFESPYRPNLSDLKAMKIGDSYAIPFSSKEEADRITAYGHVYLRKVGAKAVTRKLTENDKQVIRVWRIKW